MATGEPVAKAARKAQGSTVKAHVGTSIDCKRVPLGEISTAADSGWRPLKEDHVKGLVDVIMAGDFGKAQMTRPSLFVGADGKPCVSSEDGLFVIDNGKAWVEALKRCQEAYTAALLVACPQDPDAAACPPANAQAQDVPEDQWPDWALPALRQTYREGVLVDFMQFPTQDRLAHAAIQTLMHESDQNKYRVATVSDKVNMVRRAHSGDWANTKRDVLEVLGSPKASTVQRWITLAMGCGPDGA